MKVYLDDKALFEITDTQVKILANDLGGPIEEIKYRLEWVITHKIEACFQRLKAEWDPKLAARGIEMIPTNQEKYAELVFSQPDYKNRTEREKNVTGS